MTTPRNPRIKPIYPLYRLDPTTFRIGAQLGITAEFNDPEKQYWLLAKSMDGRPLGEIFTTMQNHFPELTEQQILDGIGLLDAEGFVEEGHPENSSALGARYEPNANYFSRFIGLTGSRFEPQNTIHGADVLLLGLGGGGSNILALLMGLGPRSITIVDHDVVEESNLGRQFLYRESDIGKPKADVAAEAVSAMNSSITIESHNLKIESVETLRPLARDKALVISAIDEPPFLAQRIVNKAIVAEDVPCVFGASQVTRGRVFSVIPKKTGCFDCLNIHYSKQDPQFISQFTASAGIEFDPPSIAYGPFLFTLTAAIVDEAIRVLTGYAPARSLSSQFEVNFEDGTTFAHPSWPRLPKDCPTCGEGDGSQWEIFSSYSKQI